MEATARHAHWLVGAEYGSRLPEAPRCNNVVIHKQHLSVAYVVKELNGHVGGAKSESPSDTP